MIGNVGLPGWFVATGLRVSLKQPNSRGIPGSFGAIFSDVNRLDVCPVGYYNRRMTFLRGTLGRVAKTVNEQVDCMPDIFVRCLFAALPQLFLQKTLK